MDFFLKILPRTFPKAFLYWMSYYSEVRTKDNSLENMGLSNSKIYFFFPLNARPKRPRPCYINNQQHNKLFLWDPRRLWRSVELCSRPNLYEPTKHLVYEKYISDFLREEPPTFQDSSIRFSIRHIQLWGLICIKKSLLYSVKLSNLIYIRMNFFRSYSPTLLESHLRKKHRLYAHSYLMMEPEDLLLTH